MSKVDRLYVAFWALWLVGSMYGIHDDYMWWIIYMVASVAVLFKAYRLAKEKE